MAATLGPPIGLSATQLVVDGEDVLVLSYELDEPELPLLLTEAERDVTRSLLRGCSMKAIGIARRTSPRTVANQVRSVYRKLRVTSLLELCLRVHGGEVTP